MTTSVEPTEALNLPQDVQDLLFREARTANNFSDEPVTDEQIRAIYELVKWAPTSMNNQPLRALVIRTEEGKKRLSPLMSEGNRAKTEAAPVTVVLAADTEFHENLPRTFPHFPGAKDLFADEAARVETAKLNALLQVGYFIIGVRAAGLAAGPMTGFDAEGIDKEFFADKPWKSLVVINVGKPGENPWFDRLPRLDFDEVVETV
ncbi:malonic semialdehyde reductase [Amycolatopsis sp. MJM2582]|uniref:Malonic semialdehyde reductase n=1 Tax=Amycolatopsis keratiniphila subsp. keratiniphila TaxID=227715 RepID=A0A1W2M162_9PSEU|nr:MULTISPECIES: malonic semialdehyde reductase [Amycolatopsis]KFZ81964.1 malonic semialdehyde reductase [Amycolatopsis sp. MJM2582]ONF73582.1 malonic semialdehyde reductase [Amycolatopsis keratiniphila subsp. keratiniphila]RSN41888.1 malonic semialdehyde reductase [Amycolatopsis sp. WAC 04197]